MIKIGDVVAVYDSSGKAHKGTVVLTYGSDTGEQVLSVKLFSDKPNTTKEVYRENVKLVRAFDH